MKQNKETLRIIEIILNEFTSEQLKFLEVQDPDNKGITTFKEAMIAFYGEMLPKFKKQEKIINITRNHILEIKNKIKVHKKLQPKKINDFIQSFNFLFIEPKPNTSWKERFVWMFKYWFTPIVISTIITLITKFL